MYSTLESAVAIAIVPFFGTYPEALCSLQNTCYSQYISIPTNGYNRNLAGSLSILNTHWTVRVVASFIDRQPIGHNIMVSCFPEGAGHETSQVVLMEVDMNYPEGNKKEW